MPSEAPLSDTRLRVLKAIFRRQVHGESPTISNLASDIGISYTRLHQILIQLRDATPPYVDSRPAQESLTNQGKPRMTPRGWYLTERGRSTIRPSVRLFYSYSHKDEKLRERLEVHLAALRRQGLIEEWHDRKITAGREWKNDIDGQLETADVILLLVSPDFLASDYAYDKELRRALDRHRSGEARVVPIILRHSDWQETPIGALQALPPEGRPVAGRGDRAWMEVAKGLREVIKEIRKAH